jgi:AraC-like DNA-binding protein
MKIGAALAGAFDLEVDGLGWVARISTGDCYLLTDGAGYRTRTDAASGEDWDAAEVFKVHAGPDGVVRWGEGEPSTVVTGARFVFDLVGLEWLRASLPPFIHVPAGAPAAAPIRATLALLAAEGAGSGPGEAVVQERLADVLLVQALRAHIQKSGETGTVGWLAGLADRRIARALEAFHRAVAEDWSVERLAQEGGMSRSSFSAYFFRRVGMTPMAYVSAWRMQRIRHALSDKGRIFAQIAAENGFSSRTAASRSFRIHFGMSPSEARSLDEKS